MEQPYLYRSYWKGDKTWVVPVADIDESESYETDITEIYFDRKEQDFLLITATGCSCWDGDYDEERFDSFELLKTALLGSGDERTYNPTLSGAGNLLAQVEAWCASEGVRV